MTIRSYTAADLRQLYALNREVVAESDNLTYTDPDGMITKFLGEENGHILVVEDTNHSDRIIAMQGYKTTTINVVNEGTVDVLKINLLRVAQEFRGQGIASELIGTTEQIAHDLGLTQVHLSVASDGPVGLYEKLGYRKYQRDGGSGIWSSTEQGRVITIDSDKQLVSFDYRKFI